jgi:hypothetical protein
MRRLLALIAFGAAALATPALALTVSPAPNRDQAPHLKQERSPSGGVDLRDTLAGGGRPFYGSDPARGSGPVQTYGFGNVTTTIYRDDRLDVRPTPGAPIYSSGGRLFPPEIVERRR